jgi:Ca-activated chloride channel homolog
LLPGTPVAKLPDMGFHVTPGWVSRRVTARLTATAIVVGAVTAGGLVTAQQPTFRSGTQFVPLFTTVTDGQGRLVPDLDRDQFTILDNGKPQNITVFENQTQPFTAIVMLDFSASMTANLDRLKQATEQFLIRMLPADKAQVGAFSDKIQFSGTFTSDRDDLIGALRDLQFGNPTRLYDAVYESIDMLGDLDGRKVVVAFTDGDDTYSRRGLGDTLDYALGLESEIQVAPGRFQRTRPDRGLKKLAEETGGGYFELKKTDDLGPTFTRVVQELHSLYTLGFNPATLDGKEHKLDVRMKQTGMTARARRSYIASSERLSSDK